MLCYGTESSRLEQINLICKFILYTGGQKVTNFEACRKSILPKFGEFLAPV